MSLFFEGDHEGPLPSYQKLLLYPVMIHIPIMWKTICPHGGDKGLMHGRIPDMAFDLPYLSEI